MLSSRWPDLNSTDADRRLISVRVRAESGKEIVVERAPTRLLIAVRQKAIHDAANRRVVVLAAKHFKVPEERVRIVKGSHTPNKILEIKGLR